MIPLLFLLAAITAGQATPSVRHFKPADKSIVPKSLLDSKYLCGDMEDFGETMTVCEEDFYQLGRVWTGDVNDDGVKELVIYLGPEWSGSAGDSYELLQKRGKQWIPLLGEDADWFTPDPRFDLLPIVRGGYHDLRVSVDLCMKWDGDDYVYYSDDDYHKLSPSFFDASHWVEAEIFWAIRYRGLNSLHLKPMWSSVPDPKEITRVVTVDDPQSNLKWVALFKGGVWGVRGNRGFLLLPQPAYKGSEKMEIDGDWLVIHGDYESPSKEPRVVARYNRVTHELKLEEALK